jgi:proteic killer suppression protein
VILGEDAQPAGVLADGAVLPGPLAGDRAGQYSIRIGQQWLICLRWTDAGPEDLEITDYH